MTLGKDGVVMEEAESGHRGPVRVFVSYRKTDASGYAGWLTDGLVAVLGEENVFRDVKSIPPGVDFRDHIWQKIEWCDVLLVVMGPSWLTVSDELGQTRLQRADDFVRLEIERALDANKRVIPVLVQDCTMPKPDQLPESLARLSYRQAHQMSDARWPDDLAVLIRRIVRPRPNRFSRWGDISRLAPLRTLLGNALVRPKWSNPVIPLATVSVGIAIDQWWLVPVGLASYLGLFLITLFDLEQARQLHARTREEKGGGQRAE